jgi:hypothetical protein
MGWLLAGWDDMGWLLARFMFRALADVRLFLQYLLSGESCQKQRERTCSESIGSTGEIL